MLKALSSATPVDSTAQGPTKARATTPVRSVSVPPQFPAAHSNTSPTIHHLPLLPMLTTNQQIWIPYIQTSGNLIPVVVSSSRSQPAHQMGNYYGADVPILVGSHQYVHQPPRSNKISDNNLMGLVMKGVVDGVAEQAGQILLGTILGDFHSTDDQ
ncbi:hypothetical protein GH714_036703 [Hevea brasiliensis]|uniref:Uncharacterized protein n=1 Tax=Hevea brasiliensis TaxID=3981 RepID=A0A6A6KMI4_HEVBR|nr:hypothetical protein GH714_036703 [Hevea brasiliensis]